MEGIDRLSMCHGNPKLMRVMNLSTLCYKTAVPLTTWSLLVAIKPLARLIPLTRQDTPYGPKGIPLLDLFVSLDITMCFCLPFFPCKTSRCDRELVKSRRVRVEYRASRRRHSRKGHVERRVGFCFFLFLLLSCSFPWDGELPHDLDFSGVLR
ncbi:hypothetical protein V8F33_008916 [Rhypophila sp. PSN 637]